MYEMIELKQFKSIVDLLEAFKTEQDCIKHLEAVRWQGNIISPYDTTSTVYKCKNNRYKCRNTNKYFNVRTNTIFGDSNIKLRTWFLAIYIFTSHKKGISSHQLAKDLNITQKSAWFILHRLRNTTLDKVQFVGEVYEVDETFVGGKNKNRHQHKKVANSQGRSFKDKTPVFGILSREDQKIQCYVVADTTAQTMQPIILDNIKQGSNVMSDEWYAYKQLNKFYNHKSVNHGNKEFVNGDCYTNTIEGFWSLFKRGIIGTYHNVSRKHLQKYADEFSFRYNHRKGLTSDNFNLFLQMTVGKRLTYKILTK